MHTYILSAPPRTWAYGPKPAIVFSRGPKPTIFVSHTDPNLPFRSRHRRSSADCCRIIYLQSKQNLATETTPNQNRIRSGRSKTTPKSALAAFQKLKVLTK